MTGLLKDVLDEQANDLGAPSLDLAAIRRDGARRVRRGRVTGAAAAAAAVAVMAGGVALVDPFADEPGVATAPASPRQLSYAVGNEIHVGDEVIETAEPVRSYVLTDTGPVWTTPDGDVMMRLHDGRDVFIGQTSTDGYYLKADDTGTLVAWMQFSPGAPPDLVVYDTAAYQEVLVTSEGTREGMGAFRDARDVAYVYAVDGRSVYWHNERGAVLTDVDSGESTVLGEANGFTIGDVADGQLAYTPVLEGSEAAEAVTRVGPSLTEGLEIPHSGNPYLSPDAGYVSFEASDVMVVVDTATGEEVTPELPGYEYKVVYTWLDDDTAAVFGIESLGGDSTTVPLDFLACDIPTGECTKVSSAQVTMGDFALPVGEHIDG